MRLVRKHIGDRFARSWNSDGIIFAEEGRQRGGNLALSHVGNLGPFAQGGCVRSEEGHPDVFRIGNFLAVVFPFVRGRAAAVIGRKNEVAVPRYSGRDCASSQNDFS